MIAISVVSQEVNAQTCAAPTLQTQYDIAQHITLGSCRQNASFDAQGVATGAATLQYQLINALNNTPSRPWQDNATFTLLPDGKYFIEARQLCNNGFSDAVRNTDTISINKAYTNPTLTDVTSSRNVTGCITPNGQFSINTITGGTAPYQYSLISSINAPSPDPNAVRPYQTSGIFSDLAAGTYYLRVKDACEETGETRVMIINSLNTIVPTNTNLTWYGCDSFIVSASLTNLNMGYPFDYWIEAGNVSSPKITFTPDLYSSVNVTPKFSNAMLGIGNGTFPDNLGTWPKEVILFTENECGARDSVKMQINRPENLQISPIRNTVQTASNCDSVEYTLSLNYLQSGEYGKSVQHKYGDITYTIATPGYTNRTGTLPENGLLSLPLNAINTITLNYCGKTLSRSVNTDIGVINATISEANNNACYGNSGFRILNITNLSGDSMKISVLKQPANSNLPFDTTIVRGQSVIFERYRNLPLGEYKIVLANAGNNTCVAQSKEFTFVLNKGLPTPDVQLSHECGGALTVYTTKKYSVGNASTPFGNYVKASLYNSSNTSLATAHRMGIAGDTTKLEFDANVINNLANGNYTIRLSVDNNISQRECNTIDIPYVKSNSPIDLSSSILFSGCNEVATAAMLVGVADGGKKPYIWSLYDANNNPIVLSQATNEFVGLSKNEVYSIRVNDACGRNANALITSAQSSIPMHIDANNMTPCAGESVKFYLDYSETFNFKWYKDDVEIPNETSNVLSLINLDATDAGVYKGAIIDAQDQCVIFSNAAYLDPINCNISLPLTLISFKGNMINNKAELNWITTNEKENKGFYVEKSTNGSAWESLSFVASTSTEFTQNNHYSYTDESINNEYQMYRLKSIALNGEKEYSHIVRLAAHAALPIMSIQPNIITNNVANVQNAKGLSLGIYNITGQLMHTFISTSDSYTLDVSMLNAGTYIIRDMKGSASPIKFQVIK